MPLISQETNNPSQLMGEIRDGSWGEGPVLQEREPKMLHPVMKI